MIIFSMIFSMQRTMRQDIVLTGDNNFIGEGIHSDGFEQSESGKLGDSEITHDDDATIVLKKGFDL